MLAPTSPMRRMGLVAGVMALRRSSASMVAGGLV
jgi:hypothetical protein